MLHYSSSKPSPFRGAHTQARSHFTTFDIISSPSTFILLHKWYKVILYSVYFSSRPGFHNITPGPDKVGWVLPFFKPERIIRTQNPQNTRIKWFCKEMNQVNSCKYTWITEKWLNIFHTVVSELIFFWIIILLYIFYYTSIRLLIICYYSCSNTSYFSGKVVGTTGSCDWKYTSVWSEEISCGRADEAVMGM